MNLYQHVKMTSFHLFIFEPRDQTPAPRDTSPHLFLTIHTQKILDQLFIFVIMYQHAKNLFIFSICSFFKYS